MYYVSLYRKKRNCEEGFSTTNNLLKWKTEQNIVYYFRQRRYWIWDTSVPRLLFPFVLYGKNALKVTVNNIASQCLALDSRVKSAWVLHKDYVGLINYLASVAQKVDNAIHRIKLSSFWTSGACLDTLRLHHWKRVPTRGECIRYVFFFRWTVSSLLILIRSLKHWGQKQVQ